MGFGLRPGAKAPDEPPSPTGYAPPLDSTVEPGLYSGAPESSSVVVRARRTPSVRSPKGRGRYASRWTPCRDRAAGEPARAAAERTGQLAQADTLLSHRHVERRRDRRRAPERQRERVCALQRSESGYRLAPQFGPRWSPRGSRRPYSIASSRVVALGDGVRQVREGDRASCLRRAPPAASVGARSLQFGRPKNDRRGAGSRPAGLQSYRRPRGREHHEDDLESVGRSCCCRCWRFPRRGRRPVPTGPSPRRSTNSGRRS